MKWRIASSDHKVGEKRKVLEFAWLPTQVEGFMVWLEHYWVVEEYTFMGEWEEVTRWLYEQKN